MDFDSNFGKVVPQDILEEANVAELDSSPKNLGKSIELDTIYSKNGRK
jgi:hypothetical protein